MTISARPESLRPHLLDASALVKLVTHEPGSDRLQAYFNGQVWFVTTILCLAEALGVLKRKWQRQQLSNQEYVDSCSWLLLRSVPDGRIKVEPSHLERWDVFFEVRNLVQQYQIDFSDALQLFTLKRTYLVSYCDGSQAVLITSDSELARVGRQEGLLVWDCHQEEQPPPSSR